MAQRSLELTLLSAKDLRQVNLLSKMKVYAVVSLSGDPRSRHQIQADRTGGRNPTWNAALRLDVPASGSGSLHVHLRAERVLCDRDVGEVHIPLAELLAGAPCAAVPVKFVAYQVLMIPTGRPQGVLDFSYKLGEVTGTGGYDPGSNALAAYAPQAAAYTRPSAYPPPASYADVYPPPYPPAGNADVGRSRRLRWWSRFGERTKRT